ncbi:MAG TPA: hypothetical protein VFH80_02470 [Solirubrobacteraceae bacterium]|nr:hypothetical protein [Solirubrobacteraceae bacterium]
MTTMAIMLNLAMAVPAVLVLVATAVFVLRASSDAADEEGRADWRGPFRHRLQRTAASIATATNSSAR